MTRPQAEINAEIEQMRPVYEARVRRIERIFEICEAVAKREMEGSYDMVSDEDEANAEALHRAAHAPDPAEQAEKVEPPAVDISSEALAELAANVRYGIRHHAHRREIADMIEAIAADRDRHRTFVCSARAIVQAYATDHPQFRRFKGASDDGEEVDPHGAHAWIRAEAAEVDTMRDGGNPKVERT
jgi:hypothetical protein